MKPIFYDTDCLSCFISIDDTSILEELFEKVIISESVYDEFSKVDFLKDRIDYLVGIGFVEIIEWDLFSEEYSLYLSLSSYFSTDKPIGNGEASAIVLAKKHDGIIASNNTKDIMKYVNMYNLEHITTGDILVKAYNENIITEEEGNNLWQKMLDRGRWLTFPSFSNYLKHNPLKDF